MKKNVKNCVFVSAVRTNKFSTLLLLRGDVLQSRAFFSKGAQNLAKQMLHRHLGFKSFSKFAKKNNIILVDFWL
jgi:hypothetical protein